MIRKPPHSRQPGLIRDLIAGLLGALIAVSVVYAYLLIAFAL
jgi:hypothetical protein